MDWHYKIRPSMITVQNFAPISHRISETSR